MFKKVLYVLFSVVLIAVVASAATKDSGSIPFFDKEKGEVVIPALPAGEIVAVEVYDDIRGIPPRTILAKGNSVRFKLEPGAGFNYRWKVSGHELWQEVAPDSKVGDGLVVDCTWKDANGVPRCKYARPIGQ